MSPASSATGGDLRRRARAGGAALARARPARRAGDGGRMSVTSTPTMRLRRPARRQPSARPATVPPLPSGTKIASGSGSAPARDLLGELERGVDVADGAERRRAAGRDDRQRPAAQQRARAAGAAPWRRRRRPTSARCSSAPAAWSSSRQCRTWSVTGCGSSTSIVAQPGVARADRGRQAVMRADAAEGDHAAAAARARRAEQPLELARLVAAVERRRSRRRA